VTEHPIELILFLHARLAEDERAARLALDHLASDEQAHSAQAGIGQMGNDRSTDDDAWARVVAVPQPLTPIGAHLTRWSPRRVLADVEHTRRLVNRCGRWLGQRYSGTEEGRARAAMAHVILCDLAAGWRHHSCWQPAWEPAPLLPLGIEDFGADRQ